MDTSSQLVTIGHNMQILYGTLCVLSADNPASSACGGFKESCSARKPCRHCLTNLSELSTRFKESQVQLRNLSDHFTIFLRLKVVVEVQLQLSME